MKTNTLTAQNCSLFEIDAELEAAFEQMQEEREITGNISDEAREHCMQLFAELGKKIDRIAAYLRTQQHKASIAAEEGQRLQQRRRSAEQRVDDWKLPQEFCLHTGSITHRLLKEMLARASAPRAVRRIPAGHDQHPTQYAAGSGCIAAR
jgi:hypothetical protein